MKNLNLFIGSIAYLIDSKEHFKEVPVIEIQKVEIDTEYLYKKSKVSKKIV